MRVLIKNYVNNEVLDKENLLIVKIRDIYNSDNLIEIKKLMRVFVSNVEFNYTNKQVSKITLNIEEDLFGYLDVKYSVKRKNEVLKFFDNFDII